MNRPVSAMPGSGATEEVLAAERERCRAISEQDWARLDALLDDTLVHTHMNGRVDTKPALMANLRARPRTVRREHVQARIFAAGAAAVLTGPQYLDLGAGEVVNQATETWIKSDGDWRLVAFHASRGDPTPRPPAPTRPEVQ